MTREQAKRIALIRLARARLKREMQVYRNPYTNQREFLLGYKGSQFLELPNRDSVDAHCTLGYLLSIP